MSLVREPGEEPLPGYRLIEPLGSGGFGEAWKCEAPGGIFKAIKFVFGNLNSMDVDGARADQELKALNRVKEIRHPFILSMDRIETVDGELVIVMELADKSLYDAAQECLGAGLVGIPRDSLLGYIRDAAEALDHMNEKHNLQHLDIKPRNLFLISNRVKVADFGLVKHLERSGLSGVLGGVTPLYAPPETFTGRISGHSDQYSLAIVYQELLTGQRPFTGKNPRQLAQQHMEEEPDLRALPEAERPVVARALSKDPERRFPNCLAFVRALYNARPAVRPGARNTGESQRPGTIYDTMEDILLEQMPGEDDNVALGAPEEESPPDAGSDSAEMVSSLGMTMALPSTGSLRPTLVIGVGSFGRRALVELRCRFLDRFGDLDRMPLVKFLYIDTDAEAIREARRGSPEVAFRDTETYHLPLQQISHYRRRQLEHLNEWLPREKLFAMPRSLKTHGSRALGRLAFADNYLRVAAKLKKAIQEVTHPDALYKSVSETSLALRDNVPRVYVVAGAGGGSSGLLPDLGFTVRRLLQQMRHPDSPLTCLLFCGAPEDPATPRGEQANLYATLTELNHFADPGVPFSAQYGSTDGPRLVQEGPAYDHTYLLTLANRTPEGRRDAMAHLGSYLFHELTTPLGLRLDACRRRRPPNAEGLVFRSLGTYSVWFPRGLLLRLAARGACLNLIQQWQAEGEPMSGEDFAPVYAKEELDAASARVLADPSLDADALTYRLADLAGEEMGGSPSDLLTRLLSNLEEQAQQVVAQDDPAAWARAATTRVREWLGGGVQPPGGAVIAARKSKLTRALESSAGRLSAEWALRLADAAHTLMENPGRRVAVAEAMFDRLLRAIDEAAKTHMAQLEKQTVRTKKAQEQLQGALQSCVSGGGFSWFGTRPKRQLRVFMDHLAAFSRQCLAEDSMMALQVFYGALRGQLADSIREMGFCRQRLRHVQEALESSLEALDTDTEAGDGVDASPAMTPLMSTETYWESIRESATTRVILPAGEEDLERAAASFVKTLTPEQWLFLDQTFQEQVLSMRGGLYQACSSTSDLVRHLVAPLLTQATECLGKHLPVTDVAAVELALTEHAPDRMPVRIRGDHANAATLTSAAPVVGTMPARSSVRCRVLRETTAEERRDHSFLLVPASETGKAYGEAASAVVPHLHLVTVPGQADLMFCREQDALSAEELERILRPCRRAYEEVAAAPPVSPHARFDIHDWTPLDP
jgi:serine/threonine protein kinase